MSILSLYWEITNVDGNIEYSIRRNIKKNILFPRYQGHWGGLDVPLAYVGSKEIDPSSNLNVTRLEDSITENSKFPFQGTSEFSGNTGYTTGIYFLLTDVVGEYASRKSEPFFQKHVLPSASIEPDSVAILDENLQPVDENSYKVIRTNARDSSDTIITGSYEDCSVFSNYTNLYSENTGELDVYFVRYEIDGTSHYSILNQQPAFSEAGPSDISSVTGQIKTWRKVYILDTSSSPYTITTPDITATYYVSLLETSRILVRDPIDKSDNDPWFLTVSNGSFIAVRNSIPYTYSIPEFSSQSFSPLYPYKIQVEEKGLHLKRDLIKVSRDDIKVDTSTYTMDILVRDSSNNTLYALTTDSSKVGNYYTEEDERIYRTIETDNEWVTWDGDGIAGYDESTGFVHLDKEYPDIYYFYVTYYYKETGYEFTSLNVNPIFDDTYNGEFYVLYVVPQGGLNDNSSQTESIQYLKVDTSGRVIQVSQDGSGGNYNLSSVYTDESMYMYYSKSANEISTVDNLAGQDFINLPDVSDWPLNGIISWESTPGKYTTRAYDRIVGNTIYFENPASVLISTVAAGTTFSVFSFKDLFSSNSSNSYQWLILGEIGISASSTVRNLSILDIRKKGGYIQEKYWEDSEKIDPRALWARSYIELNRGQVVPGESASVVKVPYTLLTDYGGNFSTDDIEAIVTNRHLATGILPVVIYHGAIPEITSISSTATTVTVCWGTEGEDYSYRVYYSASPKGPWTLSGSIASSAYGYCHTISGLTRSVVYYVSITAVSSSGIEGPKSIPWGIRTRRS
jgi:hypothetical protein